MSSPTSTDVCTPPLESPVLSLRIEWREWVALVLICLIGIGLRLYKTERLAIEHFDEGVYAANLYAEMDGFRYPKRHLYAPPLFPALCEFAVSWRGTPDAAIDVNLLFGILTVPLVWLVARGAWGPIAGILSATLAAMSDFHIFYSRSALTDVSLAFWMLLAVWLASCGIRSGRGVTIALASVAAALAWWTKYNGWLAILIPLGGWGLLAVVAYTKVGGTWRTRFASVDRSGLMLWGIFAAVAGVMWLPVLYDLQSTGGYGPVAANHGKYLVGWSGWGEAFRKHLACHARLTSAVGVAGPIVAAALVSLCRGRITWIAMTAALSAFMLGIGAGGALGPVAFMAVIGMTWGWWRHEMGSSRLFEAMIVTWWIGLTLTTPLYTPYPRLSLPWLVATWLLVGAMAGMLTAKDAILHKIWSDAFYRPPSPLGRGAGGEGRESERSPSQSVIPDLVPNHSKPWWAVVLVGTLFGTGVLGVLGSGPEVSARPHLSGIAWNKTGPAWEDRTPLREAVTAIVHEVEVGLEGMPSSQIEGADVGVYVIGEPAFFCHLAKGVATSPLRLIAQPGSRMQVTAKKAVYIPTFIVTGAHAPEDEVAAELAAGRIELLWEQKIPVSDMVALDAASVKQLLGQTFGRMGNRPPEKTIMLRLYRIKP